MGHLRPSCTSRIRCRGCRRLGHIKDNCRFGGVVSEQTPRIQPSLMQQQPPLASGHDNRQSGQLDPPAKGTTTTPVQSNQVITAAASHSHQTPPSLQQTAPLTRVCVAAAPVRLPEMATFPFDPAPFLPEGFHAIEVEGRPARHRVLHGNLAPANEDLAIATIIRMPQGEVIFVNVRKILLEFL